MTQRQPTDPQRAQVAHDRAAPELFLAPYRVLDLTDERGLLCGRVLADLGADVVQVEPPQGSPARRVGPFACGRPHPEGSLLWWFYAANKRGVTLDLATADGRALFLRLVQTAHFVVESFEPGFLDRLGLGWRVLRRANPALVLVSITPFGQRGPRARWKAGDLVGMAAAGHLYLTGDPDRAPVRVGYPQFYLHGAAAGATGAMIAHHYRRRTGRGQHVDVSCQQATARTLSSAVPAYTVEGSVVRRQGAYRQTAGSTLMRLMWACKDGHVNFQLGGGMVGGRSTRNLIRWMADEGMAEPFLEEVPWESLDYGGLTRELIDRVSPPVERWFLTHTREELYRGAVERRILMFPVNAPADIEGEEQLAARRFWESVAWDGRQAAFPGTFLWTSVWGRLPLRRAAPKLGEHNEEVLCGELGLSRQELAALHEAGVV